MRSLPAAGVGPEPGEGWGRGRAGFSGKGSGRSWAARPHRAGNGGRGVYGFLSPDVRRRRPRPERAPWGPRSLWRWAPSTTWHFSCNSAAPRGPPATRPGTTTSPATVSSVATPADFPIKPHARPRRSYLASPGLEPSRPWRASRGAPCRVHGATLAPWPLLRRAPLVHPDPTLTGKPLPTHTFVRIPHLHDHTAIHRHCHTKSHTTCFLTLTTPTSHISRHLFTTPSTLINTHTYAHYRHIRHCGWWALTLPAGTLAHTLHNSCLPACPQTHGQHTHTCIHL